MVRRAVSEWFLPVPLELAWRFEALCRGRPDLPWTPDFLPDDPVLLLQMRVLCSGCPVVRECADFGLTQPGGFYAGVWTPWADGRGVGARSERACARNALRRVRNSDTPSRVAPVAARSRDERSVSLSKRSDAAVMAPQLAVPAGGAVQ